MSSKAASRLLFEAEKLDRPLKRVIALAGDLVLCLVAAYLAFSLRVGALNFELVPFIQFVLACELVFPLIFIGSGVYSTIFRYAGMAAIRDLAIANALSALPLVLVFLLIGVPGVPRTVSLLQPILFFGLTAGSRILVRTVLIELGSRREGKAAVRRTAIYGAGGAGMQLALSLRHVPSVSVVAIVDDDHNLDRQRLEGLRVYHSDKLEDLIERLGIESVLLAMPSASRTRRREIIERVRHLPVEVRTLPQMQELVRGQVSVGDLREVQVDDLLGRDAVAPNPRLLARTIQGKTVMVTGAGGSIGSELCRQIMQLGPRCLVLVEMTEHALYQIETELRERYSGADVVAEMLSVVDAGASRRVVNRYRPDTIFHAAAYKHVPLVEANVISGLRNNVIGTLNMARAAISAGTSRFILISTDKAVRPTNVMGASKRVCELILQAFAQGDSPTTFAMVRFGNVLGSSGSVVPRFKQQIREGGPITLTHRDVTRYFMTIPEASQLVIQAGGMAEGGEVYLLDMGASVRIHDLARTMIELSGLTVRDEGSPDGDIEIVEVGLRPGEKLYEELLIGAESQATGHPRISRAHERSLPPQVLQGFLASLTEALDKGDAESAVALLRTLVPEYGPEAAEICGDRPQGVVNA